MTSADMTNVSSVGAERPPDVRVLPEFRPGRLGAAIALLVLAAMLIHTVFSNPHFQWNVVLSYFTSERILLGLARTLELTAISMIIGIILGIVLALMRMSSNPIISYLSGLYIWIFRATPLLVQIIFWYNLSALYPELSFGIPFGPGFIHYSANTLISPLAAAVLALSLNEAAYMAEIIRAGILSVDDGQYDAALASGMRRLQMMRWVILPQAARVIVPPTGNQVIGMLKSTALVSVIAMPELLYSAQIIYAENFETIPLLIVACVWYLIVTTILTIGQRFVERYFTKGARAKVSRPQPDDEEFGNLARASHN